MVDFALDHLFIDGIRHLEDPGRGDIIPAFLQLLVWFIAHGPPSQPPKRPQRSASLIDWRITASLLDFISISLMVEASLGYSNSPFILAICLLCRCPSMSLYPLALFQSLDPAIPPCFIVV